MDLSIVKTPIIHTTVNQNQQHDAYDTNGTEFPGNYNPNDNFSLNPSVLSPSAANLAFKL